MVNSNSDNDNFHYWILQPLKILILKKKTSEITDILMLSGKKSLQNDSNYMLRSSYMCFRVSRGHKQKLDFEWKRVYPTVCIQRSCHSCVRKTERCYRRAWTEFNSYSYWCNRTVGEMNQGRTQKWKSCDIIGLLGSRESG